MKVEWYPGRPAVFWSWRHNCWLMIGPDGQSAELPIKVYYRSRTGKTGAGHMPDVGWLVPVNVFEPNYPPTHGCDFSAPWVQIREGRPWVPVVLGVTYGSWQVVIRLSWDWPWQQQQLPCTETVNLDWVEGAMAINVHHDSPGSLEYEHRLLCRRIGGKTVAERRGITFVHTNLPAWDALGVRSFRGSGMNSTGLAFERWGLPVKFATESELRNPEFCRQFATRRVWWIDDQRFAVGDRVYTLQDPSWSRTVSGNEWRRVEEADWWPTAPQPPLRKIRIRENQEGTDDNQDDQTDPDSRLSASTDNVTTRSAP